ncbi:MAG: hypothetical protein ACTSYD_01265 [Candidatus Heimdallarchaeaceae archaeon]
MEIVILRESQLLCVDIQGNILQNWPKAQINTSSSSGRITVADIDKDANKEIVLFNGKTLYIYNFSGDLVKQTSVFSNFNEGLLDNDELIINSNPYSNDTDDDGVSDYKELLYDADPNSNDTDDDGLLDGEEYYICDTLINSANSDKDGLTDYAEVRIYHTNPLKSDSDGDGVSDFLEIQHGTDPLSHYSNIHNRRIFLITLSLTSILLSFVSGCYITKKIVELKLANYALKAILASFKDEEEMEVIREMGYQTKKEYEESFAKSFIARKEEIATKLLKTSIAVWNLVYKHEQARKSIKKIKKILNKKERRKT